MPERGVVVGDRSPWFRRLTDGTGTRTIVVLPPAGAGATMYRPWAKATDDRTEVLVATAPGREHRITEVPHQHVGPIADAIADELAAINQPSVLFGHSAGALVAREVAGRLRNGPVEHVVVAAAASPDYGGTNYALATDAELLQAMRSWGGTPPEVLKDESVAELFLPCLRADLAVAHSCRTAASDDLELDVPITVLIGDEDQFVTPKEAAGWERWTTSAFTLKTMPGGHFFPVTNAPAVVALVAGTLT